MPLSESSSITLTNEPSRQPQCTCPTEENGTSAAVASLEAKVQRVERWLVQDLRHGRAEQRLLEDIIHIKEEDLEYHKQRLIGVQGQVMRLERELVDCRWELLQCRRQHRQMFADNVRLQGDNNKLQILIAQLRPYSLKQVNNSWVQFSDTAL